MWNIKTFGLAASEEKSFENVDADGRRTLMDGRRMPPYTISSPLGLWLRWAKKKTFKFFPVWFLLKKILYITLSCFRIKMLIYRAFMWFLSCMSSHMYDQHILGLKWLLFPTTLAPPTHKCLLVSLDMVLVDMLKRNQTWILMSW